MIAREQGYDNIMYETGHMAIGIIFGKLLQRITKTKINIPLLCIFSILSDIDMFHPFGLKHGGLTHSIVFITLYFLPLTLIFKRNVIPYYIANLSHPLIGDTFFLPLRLLLPLSSQRYGIYELIVSNSVEHIFIEYSLCIIALFILIKSNDFKILYNPGKDNLLFIIPLLSLLFTFNLSPSSMMPLPISIILLHFMFIVIFSYSILITLQTLCMRVKTT